MDGLAQQAIATLLVSLRIAPCLGFSQPFTLLRVPAIVRVILAITIAAWLVDSHPAETWHQPIWENGLPWAVISELMLGITLALTLQLAFAALLTAGRTIDIQAGLGLAVLVDPTTRTQLPLVGTLFAYAAGAVFFAIGGCADLLAAISASVEHIPLGAADIGRSPATMIAYCSSVFVMAFGLSGLVLLTLFLLDLIVAFLSRTLPQMNVMLLGFQVKAIATLAVLPIALAFSGALFARLLRTALETMPRVL